MSSIDEDIADNKSFAEVGFSYVIGFELEIKLGLSSAHPSCILIEKIERKIILCHRIYYFHQAFYMFICMIHSI